VADPALVTTGPEDVLHLLRSAELTVEGRLVDASNATLYCSAELDGATVAVVYKPVRGERPLWDFPDGTLAGREVAAYLVSEATGWDVVPPPSCATGPSGPACASCWVDVDESVDLARWPAATTRTCAGWPSSTPVVNNATARAAPAARARRPGARRGPRRLLLRRGQAATLLWQWRGLPLTDEAVEVLSGLRPSSRGRCARRCTSC
jgi:hypothetical protein